MDVVTPIVNRVLATWDRLGGRPDLHLGIGVGPSSGVACGEDGAARAVTTASVVNRGRSAVNVSALELVLTDGSSIPMPNHFLVASSKPLPTALAPGEYATCWVSFAELHESLTASGLRLRYLRADVPGAGPVRRFVPADWRRLGTAARLATDPATAAPLPEVVAERA